VIRFQFRVSSPAQDRAGLVKRIADLGEVAVEPLFPGEADGELAALYTARFAELDLGDRVIETLRRSPLVEFVEGDVVRGLNG